MKNRILKIIPFIGIIVMVIYFASCHQTYDSNNIPSGSTSNKTSDELYNGTGDGNKNDAVMDKKDTGHTVEMEPANSTSASTLTSHTQKK